MSTLPSSRFSRGFTALELLVTIAILGVLAAIALPSFNPLMERWRIRQASEELQSTFYFARTEAVKRGGGIMIQPSGDTADCTAVGTDGSLWSCGWSVLADTSNGGQETLQTIAPPVRVNISAADISNAKLSQPVRVDRWGRLSSDTASNFSFQLSPVSGNSSTATTVCILSSGQIKQVNSANASCTVSS